MPSAEELHEIRGLIERLETTALKMDKQAVKDRYELQAAIDNIGYQLTALNQRLNQHVDIVAQQAAIIRGFEDARQRDLGSKGTIKLLWGIIGTGIAAIAYTLHDVVGVLTAIFWPPKGH